MRRIWSSFVSGSALASLLLGCSSSSSTAANDGETTSPPAVGSSSGSGGASSGGGSRAFGGTSSGGALASGGASSGGAPGSGGASSDAGKPRDASTEIGTLRDASGGGDAALVVDGAITRPGAADSGGGCRSDHLPVVENADAAAGPVNPIPSNLWAPPATFHEPAGTYVYLSSEKGDFIGGGQTLTYTPANSTLTFIDTTRRLSLTVEVQQDLVWSGVFEAMNAADRLEVGYYPSLTRYPFNPFPEGGLDWSGEGRGCNAETGWFAIDRATYKCGVLTDLVLRFEQHCEGAVPALHGEIRWDAEDESSS